jgi:alpha-beta hydrolase superfamily lysophospholipase
MKQAIETPFGKAKVYSAETPEAREHTMVVPGYSESVSHSKKLVDALAGQGFDAFTFSQPRRKGKEPVNDPIDRQGEIVLDVLESTLPNGDKVHAVAHSLGSAAVLKVAQVAPERFASLTLVQPVGMVGEQNFPELLGRVGKKVTKNQVGALRSQDPQRQPKTGYAASADTESAVCYSARVAHSQLAGSGVLAKQPTLAVQEATAVGSYEMADDIAKVKELGIPVNIVKAHSDEMFDHDKMDAGYAGIAESVDSYSSVADRNARHDTFWMQPERTARIVGQLIHQA